MLKNNSSEKLHFATGNASSCVLSLLLIHAEGGFLLFRVNAKILYSLSESVKNVKVSVGVSGATPGDFLGLVGGWGELHHPVPAAEDEPRP